MDAKEALANLNTKLDGIQTLVGQNADGVKQLGVDLKAILDKINAGGALTAADIQPLIDKADGIATNLTATVAEEAADDAGVPKT